MSSVFLHCARCHWLIGEWSERARCAHTRTHTHTHTHARAHAHARTHIHTQTHTPHTHTHTHTHTQSRVSDLQILTNHWSWRRVQVYTHKEIRSNAFDKILSNTTWFHSYGNNYKDILFVVFATDSCALHGNSIAHARSC